MQAANFSYLGIFFGVSVVVGYAGGSWADRRLHTAPWLMLLGVLCGIAAGFKELLRLGRRFQRESRRSAAGDEPPMTQEQGKGPDQGGAS